MITILLPLLIYFLIGVSLATYCAIMNNRVDIIDFIIISLFYTPIVIAFCIYLLIEKIKLWRKKWR